MNEEHLYDARSPITRVQTWRNDTHGKITCEAAYSETTSPVFVGQTVFDASDPVNPRLFISDALRAQLIEAGWTPPAAAEGVEGP